MAIPRIADSFPEPILRPYSALSDEDRKCLDIYLFTKMPFTEIYGMFNDIRGMSQSALKRVSGELLESQSASDYLSDRKDQVIRFFNPDLNSDEYMGEDGKLRPEVSRKVLNRGIKYALEGDIEKNEPLKAVFGSILKRQDMSADPQPPIRVLAEQCSTCIYRTFCEDNCEKVCDRCKYQIDSEVKYDHKNQLIGEKENVY
jgi:hypothetical protein